MGLKVIIEKREKGEAEITLSVQGRIVVVGWENYINFEEELLSMVNRYAV